MSYKIITGDIRKALKDFPDESLDVLITDPPYGLNAPVDIIKTLSGWLEKGESKLKYKGRGFMGHGWDAEVPPPACWKEVYRVLKPGAYGAVFAGTRTQDLMCLSLRLAGFEIRDCCAWVYGQGYPSGNVRGPVEGTGTRLKPGHEPIIIIRKPLDAQTVHQNFYKHGLGFINVDAARVPVDKGLGRWPANIIFDEDAGSILDAQTGERPGMKSGGAHKNKTSSIFGGPDSTHTARADNGGPSRFFYCPKTTRKEKDEGLESREPMEGSVLVGRKASSKGIKNAAAGAGRTSGGKNPHPTVKPLELMKWLVRLLCPTPGLIVLDPFAGTGTTGIAALLEGHEFLGIEISAEYATIAKERIAHWGRKS